MKEQRQSLILEIIERQNIETQGQLLERLKEQGITATQATISRDIKEMHLIKEPCGQGSYRYAVSHRVERTLPQDEREKLEGIFQACVKEIRRAQNLVVLRTMPGLASAACSALDNMDYPDMVGSLAGDDTAFVALESNEAAEAFCRMLRGMLQA